MTNIAQPKSKKPILKTILDSKELIFTFASRDIKVRYRYSFLGYFWALIPQVVTVALFTMLLHKKVFNMGSTELPYVLHALWSMSIWQLFSVNIMNAQNSLKSSGNLIHKNNFEWVSIVFASIFPALLDFCIRLLPILLVSVYYGYVPTFHVLLIPVFLFLIVLMALGIGLFLSCINLVFSDLANIVSICLTFGMFMAPILYPPPVDGLFSLINVINPFSPLLIAIQQLLAGQWTMNWLHLLWSISFAVIVFALGWRFFHLAMPRIVERA